MYYCLLERQKFPTFDCDKLGQCDQCKRYQRGGYPPNYPMPAIPTQVSWQPAHHTQLYPSAYWYVSSYRLLWTFFQKLGHIVEVR